MLELTVDELMRLCVLQRVNVVGLRLQFVLFNSPVTVKVSYLCLTETKLLFLLCS